MTEATPATEEGSRVCSMCGEDKPLEAFYLDRTRANGNGRQRGCRDCRRVYMRERARRKSRRKAERERRKREREEERRRRGRETVLDKRQLLHMVLQKNAQKRREMFEL